MTIQSFTFNPFQTNCYVCHDAGEAVIVDASSSTEEEHQRIVSYIEERRLTVRHLLLTHAHIDHLFGCVFLARHYDKAWQMHAEDRPLLKRAGEQASAFGVEMKEAPAPPSTLEEGDVISFGSARWKVLHTPGHSPGSISFYTAESKAVLSGDVLFQGSIGRTDLPGASRAELMRTISEKMIPLGDETTVYPGHGPATTIASERAANPFLSEEPF